MSDIVTQKAALLERSKAALAATGFDLSKLSAKVAKADEVRRRLQAKDVSADELARLREEVHQIETELMRGLTELAARLDAETGPRRWTFKVERNPTTQLVETMIATPGG